MMETPDQLFFRYLNTYGMWMHMGMTNYTTNTAKKWNFLQKFSQDIKFENLKIFIS